MGKTISNLSQLMKQPIVEDSVKIAVNKQTQSIQRDSEIVNNET